MGFADRILPKAKSPPPAGRQAPSSSIAPPLVSHWQPPTSYSSPYDPMPLPGQANEPTYGVNQPVYGAYPQPPTHGPGMTGYGAGDNVYEMPTNYWQPVIKPVPENGNDKPENPPAKPELDPGQVDAESLQAIQPPVDDVPSSQDKPQKNGYAPLKTSGEDGSSINVNELAPPVNETAPGTTPEIIYNVNRPTCSLNIVCYRSGQEGCKFEQLMCIHQSKYPSQEAFNQALLANPSFVASDYVFFKELRRLYEMKMCTFFRRHFSLKTHQGFRILSYTRNTRPTVVPFDGFILQEMMYAYRNPKESMSSTDWVQWVYRLRRKDKRHAIEFVEGWDSTRITIAGSFPWLASCLIAIIWTAAGGDPQTTFTVASFILTSSSIILALLAIVSSLESSGNNGM